MMARNSPLGVCGRLHARLLALLQEVQDTSLQMLALPHLRGVRELDVQGILWWAEMSEALLAGDAPSEVCRQVR